LLLALMLAAAILLLALMLAAAMYAVSAGNSLLSKPISQL
jgi:hypothetical protein